MIETQNIGIIALGWLGESLADFLKTNENEVWGTVTSSEKAYRISHKEITTLVWKSEDTFSQELKKWLGKTDVLILNLPPSVFKTITYAEGLSSFVPYLNENTKVIFTSSTGVYPNHLEDAKEDYVFLKEDSNKLIEAEKTLLQQLTNRLCILRLAGLVGEDRNPVHYLVKKELNDNPGKKVNLIHRSDILQIIKKVIDENHFGEIFNVCSPFHPSRKEYYSTKAQEFNLGKITFSKETGREHNKVVNCSKLQVNLNYNKFHLL